MPRRRILAAAAFAVVLSGAAREAGAQSLPYISSESASTFVPLAAGTTVPYTSMVPDDDAATIPIGFTFSFYGAPFTYVNAAVNGVLEFATPCTMTTPCASFDETCNTNNVCSRTFVSSGGVGNLPSAGPPDNLIAGWYDDLIFGTGTTMTYATVGTAPNREFVLEFNRMQRFPSSMATVTFQIRLSEGSNAIKIVYGPYNSATDNSVLHGGIGIENADASMSLEPLPCAVSPQVCDFNTLTALQNQALQFFAPTHADLAGRLTGPTGGQPGDQVSIPVSVKNIGVRSTGVGFSANVYLSRRTTVSTTAAISLGSVSFPVLAASQTATVTLSAAIPAATGQAYYYLAAIVDPANAVQQDVTNNKVAIAPGRFLVGNDVGVAIDPIPATGPSDTIQFPLHLLNNGGALPSVQWAVYFSMDQMHHSTDILLAMGSSPIPAVPVTTITVTATIPANIVPGAYYPIAVVDPNNLIMDVDRSNNVAAASLSTTIRGPQLMAVSVSGPPFAFHGLPYVITATMRNDGLAPASHFYYGFYASTFPLITFMANQLTEAGPITLMPGESRTVVQSVNISPMIATGPYYLGIILDTRSNVIEQNQSGNITHSPSTITIRDPAPDLTGSDIRVPASAAAGESFTVERTLSNIGVAPASGSYAIYLTQTATIDPNRDYLVATKMFSLAAMQDDQSSDQVRIPGNVPGGNYYVAYWIDPMNQIDELRKDNNIIFSTSNISVLASSLAILTRTLPIGTLSLPYEVALAAAGGSGTYTWSMAGGTLPPGLTFDASRGWITGTPTMEGIFTFTVSVGDGHLMVNQDYHLLIASETRPLQVITRSLIPAFVGRRYEYPLTAFGGVPPYLWRADDPLPSGLALSQMGVLAGTATSARVTTVNFEVKDAAGKSASRPIVVRVIKSDGSLRFSEDVLPDARLGEHYDQAVRVESGTGMAPFAFDVAEGQLPPGLDLVPDPTKGDQARIQGVPTQVGTFTVGIRVRDARNDFDLNLFVIAVQQGQGVGFVTTSLPTGTAGQPYVDDAGQTVRVKAVAPSSNGMINYSLVSGALPKGLSLGGDGTIRGTPTQGGVSSFIIAAKDTQDEIDVAAFGIFVKDAPMTTTATKAKSGGCKCSASHASLADGRAAGLGFGSLALVAALLLALMPRARRIIILAAAAAALFQAEAVFAQPAPLPYTIATDTKPYVPRMGTPVTLLSFGTPDNDEGTAFIQIPFPFQFYSNMYSTINVSANGIASFDPNAILDAFNTVLPNPGGFTNNVIAPFWNNLVVSGVNTTLEGTAPNRVFIIEWDGVGQSPAGTQDGFTSFQLWLYEGPGARFEVHYGPMTGTVNSAAWSGTTGFDNGDGSDGHYFFSCNNTCSGSALASAGGTVYRASQDGGVDLVASGIMVPDVMYPGIPFGFRATITSLHGAPIGPFLYQIHLVPDGAVVPNDPIYTSSPITLAPFQVYVGTGSITLSQTVMTGHYRIALVVDSSNQVMDVNRANDTLIPDGTLKVEARRPDFTITRIGAMPPFVLMPGGSKDVTLVLANIGNLDSAMGYGVYLARHQVVSPDDLQVANGMISLHMGETATVTAHLSIPAAAATGTYYLGAIADPMNLVAELSKLNNTFVFPTAFTIASNMLNVTTTALPRGYEGVDYSVFLAASGGDGSYSWSITSGALPAGLSLIPQTGEIHGVPMMQMSAPITVQVSSAGLTATANLTLSIDPVNAGLTIVTRELLPGIVGDAYPPTDLGVAKDMAQHIVAVGGMGTVTYTLTSTAPPGLMLDPDGYLHGTPETRGVFDVAVKVSDASTSVSRTIPLTIAEAGRISLVAATLPDARIGEDYQYQIRVVGRVATATTPLIFTTPGPLPMGMALGSTGIVAGIPQKVGATVFTVQVTDNGRTPQRDQANFRIAVVADTGFKITPTTLPQATVGVAYDQTLDAVLEGGDAVQPITWRVQGPMLPKGLMTGVKDDGGKKRFGIKGTPEEPGFATVLVSADDGAGRHADAAISVYVVPAPPMVKVLPTKTGRCGCTSAVSERASLAGTGIGVLILLALGLSRRRFSRPSMPRPR